METIGGHQRSSVNVNGRLPFKVCHRDPLANRMESTSNPIRWRKPQASCDIVSWVRAMSNLGQTYNRLSPISFVQTISILVSAVALIAAIGSGQVLQASSCHNGQDHRSITFADRGESIGPSDSGAFGAFVVQRVGCACPVAMGVGEHCGLEDRVGDLMVSLYTKSCNKAWRSAFSDLWTLITHASARSDWGSDHQFSGH